MKGLIIIMAGLLVLFWGDLDAQGNVDESAAESFPTVRQAESIDQISGSWHGFPSGLLLQINEDGSAQFGQNRDGTLIGYRAEMELKGSQFHVRFNDYSGFEASCQSAIGIYTVQINDNGAVRFDPVGADL